MGLSKKEIRNIIDQGWEERRAKILLRSAKNSLQTKEWINREKLNQNKNRKKHFLQ